MRIRAAVLEEFGQPLVVQEVDLAEPKAGEALVRLAACGVCHTDLYTASGADPSGYAPCVLGHEGAGVVEAVGPGTTLVASGDHVITLFAPECGECVHCRSSRTNRCVAIRDQQGLGYLPDGTTRLSRDGEPLRHFHGHLDVRRVRGPAGDRPREGDSEAPLEGCAPFACGLSTGIGAALEHGPGRAGLDGGRVRLRPRRPRRGNRGAPRRRRPHRCDRPLRGAARAGAPPRGDRDAVAGDDTVEWIRAETGGFGADYTFEATGNVAVMRQAVEAAREAWGLATMCGVAGKGEVLEVVPRFLITGRRVTGSSFGGVKGRTQVPGYVDRWLAGRSTSTR